MGKLLALFLFFAPNAFAKSTSLNVGCVKRVSICDLTTKKCNWSSKPGQIFSIELNATGTSPAYEIWEGGLDLNLEGQPFHLSIYQRREKNKSADYLSIDLPMSGATISSTGLELVQVLYFNEADLSGTGIRCTTAVNPAP